MQNTKGMSTTSVAVVVAIIVVVVGVWYYMTQWNAPAADQGANVADVVADTAVAGDAAAPAAVPAPAQ
ncbi:MAG: hypothetical protein HYS74_00010 [Parcubacteria group bacterium]|nr:hypothetical protein [Parcubacteria group bacterium]